jgi:FkbM family methyltransferase
VTGREQAGTGLRRLIDHMGPLRAAVKSDAGQYLVQTARGARVVRESLRFVALQTGPQRLADYHVGDSEAIVFLRHRTRDVNILNEIFGGTGGHDSYDPPDPVVRLLDANPAPVIFDLGGNIGLFAVYALGRWPGSKVQSFEPDPTNLTVLRRTFAGNQFGERWSISDVAVSNAAAEMEFVAGLSADSYLSGGIEGADEDAGAATAAGGHTITVQAIDFLATEPRGDLIKMDIEGGEWAILTDPRFAELQVDILVLEWHARGCPFPDPHEAVLRLLRESGYDHLQEIAYTSGSGVLWAWKDGAGDRR